MNTMLCAGVDEAGRGPLAGPVVVAAVILNPRHPIDGLADSKQLGEKRRLALAQRIRSDALAWHIVSIDVAQIDALNILQATMHGMARAVQALDPAPQMALIDGNRAPAMSCQCQTIVKGDQIEPAISAASILAKVHRDAIMLQLHGVYPDYGFDRHKGYPTPQHLDRLKRFGPCPEHRRSFAPVREALVLG